MSGGFAARQMGHPLPPHAPLQTLLYGFATAIKLMPLAVNHISFL